MHDRIDARLWADHHYQFSAEVAQALKWVWRFVSSIEKTPHPARWRPSRGTPC